MIKEIHLKREDCLPDEALDEIGGSNLDMSSVHTIISEDTDVFKPDGSVLLKYRRNVVPVEMCAATFPVWYDAATPTDNRGMAAGAPEVGEDGKIKGKRKEHGKIIIPDSDTTSGGGVRTRLKFMKKDGTVSKKTVAKTVLSGVVGFMDGNPRFPYCRLTAFNLKEIDRFNECMPMIRLIDAKFAELMPDRHRAQMEYHARTSEDFKIPGTSFTTITVNRNFPTAVHKDAGDLKEGFGVMSCLRTGPKGISDKSYSGGYTAFPKYKVAVDMQTGCICCADVHEFHGNLPIRGIPGTYNRVSLVFYYREKIASCGSAEQERQRAERRQEERLLGDPQRELL